MTVIFDPSGFLDIASDSADLPESGDGRTLTSNALTRCKNLRINQRGIAKTRDGSAKLNSTAIGTPVWWIEEQSGTRYAFAGTAIYEDETSIASGLTSAQWTAIKYNAFNDTADNVFALNGTDRKRIESSTAYEWGIDAPTTAPTLTVGSNTGLTGQYNVKYTYVRKVSGVTVAESNPSPAATTYVTLADQSLLVSVTAPTDSQVTHVRLYRTAADGYIYYRDQDIPVDTYLYGVTHTWEEDDAYLSGDGFKFTVKDTTNGTDNTHTWEEVFSIEAPNNPFYTGNEWYQETESAYVLYVAYILSTGGTPVSYEEYLAFFE